MVKKFSSLNKSQTSKLHNELKEEYENYSSLEIDEEYSRLKTTYEKLQVYTELNKENNEEYKRLRAEYQSAKNKSQRARSTAINNMGTIKAIGTLFSSDKYYSIEHQEAVDNEQRIAKTISSFQHNIYAEEISERKALYHKLKVISEIRKKHKEARTRSLANSKMNKVRSSSSSLKRKALEVHGATIQCPYCSNNFERSEMVLDHIYPVAEGGLDTEKNTVLVCFKCNSQKSDLTLRIFSKKYKFNYDEICERLDLLSKNF